MSACPNLQLDDYTLGEAVSKGGFSMPGYHVWCGAVIRAEDGRYHLFASRWSKELPFTAWVTSSEIVRATSNTPEGPFEFEAVVLTQRDPSFWDGGGVHNPVILKNPQGGYLLYYSASTFTGDLNTSPPEGAKHYDQWKEAWNQQAIGLATAPSIHGPWKRSEQPILEARPGKWDAVTATNPSVTYDPKLGWLMLYKSIQKPYTGDKLPAAFQFGVCRSNHPEGPFERLQDGPLFADFPDADLEDPYLWHNGTCLEMIAKDMTGTIAGTPRAGVRAYSENGYDWKLPKSPCFYTRHLNWDDGTVGEQDFLERVWILIEDGHPSHLYFATANSGATYFDLHDSRNISVRLKRL
jgi:beta-xylosidase